LIFFLRPPTDFKPAFHAVGCFCLLDQKILLLLRQSGRPQPNTWGMPAGKVKPGECLLPAMQRELMEETGIETDIEQLVYFNTLYVRFQDPEPKLNFVYHTYSLNLKVRPTVIINPREHQQFGWFKPRQALELELIPVLSDLIKIYFYPI